jgi:hypothetical protein
VAPPAGGTHLEGYGTVDGRPHSAGPAQAKPYIRLPSTSETLKQ